MTMRCFRPKHVPGVVQEAKDHDQSTVQQSNRNNNRNRSCRRRGGGGRGPASTTDDGSSAALLHHSRSSSLSNRPYTGADDTVKDDRRAVDWWRHQQQHSQHDDAVQATTTAASQSQSELDRLLPPSLTDSSSNQIRRSTASSVPTDEATSVVKERTTLQQSQEQSHINPLEEPYELRSVNGNVGLTAAGGTGLKMMNSNTKKEQLNLSTATASTMTTTTTTDETVHTSVDTIHLVLEPEGMVPSASYDDYYDNGNNDGDDNDRRSPFVRSYDEKIAAIIAKVDSLDAGDRASSSATTDLRDNTTLTHGIAAHGRGRGHPKQNMLLLQQQQQQLLPPAAAATATTAESKIRSRPKLPLTQFMDRQKQKQSKDAAGIVRAKRTDSVSHLSDVPSDCDSVIKERYLLACQMLKTTMIQKETTLIPIEKEFLLSLLGDLETDIAADGSIVSEQQVQEIERATLRLESDPILQQPILVTTPPRQPPTTMQRVGSASSGSGGGVKGGDVVLQNQQSIFRPRTNLEFTGLTPPTRQWPTTTTTTSPSSSALTSTTISDKNPHTATRKPRQRILQALASNNPCTPRGGTNRWVQDDGIDVGTVDRNVMILDDGQLDVDESLNEPTGATPSGLELQDDGDTNDDGELVRFDGWSFERSSEFPFLILGAADVGNLNPRVVTPSMMEALRSFMPYRVTESNFWLKFSLVRDGSSLGTLLSTVRGSTYTLIGVETTYGEVFGSFTGAPWKIGSKWFGNGEAFLWRLKKQRYTTAKNARSSTFEREMEVYPYTGYDNMVQYCTPRTIAVGGGDWMGNGDQIGSIDAPMGIGFMLDGDLAGGETNSCATFANPRLAKQTSASSEFTIRNVEVWTMTPCPTVADATRMEMQNMVVEEQHSPLRKRFM